MSPAFSESRKHSIACIPGDGIGIEVVAAAVKVLKTLAEVDGSFDLAFEDYDWSSARYKSTGQYIPEGGLDSLRKHDAILFGAVGAPGTSKEHFCSGKATYMLRQTFQTMSPYGDFALLSASHFSSTPM